MRHQLSTGWAKAVGRASRPVNRRGGMEPAISTQSLQELPAGRLTRRLLTGWAELPSLFVPAVFARHGRAKKPSHGPDPSHGPARPTFCQVPRSAKFHVLTYPTASAQRLVGLGKSGAFSDQFPEEDAAGDGGVE